MLQSVKWGEFLLRDLFEVASSKKIYHANNLENIFKNQIKGSFPYVVRTTRQNGVRGYIIEDEQYTNDANTLSFAQDTFSVFYQKQKFFTGNKVKILKPKFKNQNEKIMQYITACFQKALSRLSWGVGSTVDTIKIIKIQLPICENGAINFSFMEKFIAELEATHIAELEATHIAELEAYLSVTGLKDYKLTKEERQALKDFENKEIKWKDFRIGDLFTRIKTNKLPYKAKELPQEETGKYNLPCLTSSFQNQGLNYFAPREGATILKNVISIPSNSDVYKAYYQSRDFTVLSDAYAIKFQKLKEITSKKYLFLVTSINKKTNLPIYSYKNKLGGWNVVKDKFIKLPIKEQEEIDYEFMENFILAIKKLIIKDVVEFSNSKISTTKKVLNK
ncbi:type IIB restriction/modification system, specificity subunit [Campylobacter blaseri]|uniref:Restriction endonuclease n=1 Tax=Campylobacter blaseri TaxID=2042961 RepID=A0A2P8QZ14_9BACT|nr:restriction endonuclease subunit S [Campylobacter blaseri]PSM51481.1 restriction endonuclease [Campylobacter blaseri]PSM52930.1 restriction endonuclease [Campylobacter blaseri]QKF86511.1 type IIB restriction/modification system, specificity subunit [Campylobacter blaseri]